MSLNRQQRLTKAVVDDGVYQTRQLLRKADRKSVDALDKANREAAKPIIDYAKKITPEAPLSQWAKYGWSRRGEKVEVNRGTKKNPNIGLEGALDWNRNDIWKGYKFKAGKKSNFTGVRTLLRFTNESPAGSIFEVAGRGKMKGKTPQGKAFVRNLMRNFPRTSRLVWQAVDDMGADELREKIIENYNELIDEFNRGVDKIGYLTSSKIKMARRIGG